METVTLAIPVPDLSALPTWAWALLVAKLWYAFAAWFVRNKARHVDFAFGERYHDGWDPGHRFFCWAVSPVLLPIALFCGTGRVFARRFLTNPADREGL
jgi:hypothetical protein